VPPESGARRLMVLVMSVMLAQESAEWASFFPSIWGVSEGTQTVAKRHHQEAPRSKQFRPGLNAKKFTFTEFHRGGGNSPSAFKHATVCDARPATHKWEQTEVASWIPGAGNIAADRRGRAVAAVQSNRHA
jgi:hypothetical protein